MVDWWYYNNLFAVEDGLFYENNKRLGYYQDEKEDEILKNNHKATVDRMLELKELNVEFKRIHNKLKRENKELKEENERLRKENTALDNENAEHLADNIRELELLEKLTKFLHECDLSDEQRALFRDMITEEDLQPNLEHQTWKWKGDDE